MKKLLKCSIFCTAILLFLSVNLEAQKLRGNYNFLSFEQKPYYFGITLGYNSMNLKVHHSEEFIRNNDFNLVHSIAFPGVNLGIVTNLKMGKYFDLRFLPTLSLTGRQLDFEQRSDTEPKTSQHNDAVLIETPFHIRYKSKVYKDKRAFVIAGVKYSYDVASTAGSRDNDKLVNVAPNDFAIEFGAGVQFFLPYFIFSPEIKFSHGLGNVLIYNPDLGKSTILEKLVSRAFTISLHFEG